MLTMKTQAVFADTVILGFLALGVFGCSDAPHSDDDARLEDDLSSGGTAPEVPVPDGTGGAEESGVGGSTGGALTEARHLSTPAELAQRSADLYQDNESGLIHPETLSRWLSNWETERPLSVEGDLVVLQLGRAETERPFSPSDAGVRTFLADDLSQLLQVRFNGVAAIGWSPGRGVRVDSYLRRYRIDPARDFVLLASGSGNVGDLSVLAQAWLTLRYWGFDHSNLGILQGSVVDGLSEGERAEIALEPPFDGLSRVPSLGRDYFSLLASIETVQGAVTAEHPLLDLRTEGQFEGITLSSSAVDDTCLAGPPLCTAVYGGHIPGALHLPVEALFTPDGRTLRSLAEIDAALASVGLGSDTEVIVYDDDGSASAVAAFTLLAVAGVPARWYASSFVEWGSLNASHPEAALRSLPSDSPWRTDTGVSIGAWADVQHGLRPLVLYPYAPFADALFIEDRAYLESPPPLPAVGGGGSGCSDE